MALSKTLVPDSEDVFGKQRVVSYDITPDTSYPTGGYAFTAANLGWSELKGMTVIGGNSASGGYKAHYDTVNKKIMVFRQAGLTPAGTLSKPTFTVEASGAIGTNMEVGLSADSAAATFEGGTGITAQRTLTTTSPVGTPTFTGTAVSAGALAEVAGSVNLSSLTFRVEFRGV